MDCNMQTPYIFSALNGSACDTNGDTVFGRNELARAFILPQSYENITDPPSALNAGTMFCDLYMPYTPQCCC